MQCPSILLNGPWEIGDEREYTSTAQVPGIVRDPTVPQRGTLWLRRTVRLPEEPFERVFLLLKGARFRPSAYVDGVLCAQAEGGIGQLRLPLSHPACRPGGSFTLEICLRSLSDVPVGDASRISDTDRWRTNVSSCLWDDVVLYMTGAAAIERVVPMCTQTQVRAAVTVDAPAQRPYQLRMVLEREGEAVSQTAWLEHVGERVELEAPVSAPLELWDERRPALYTMTVFIRCDGVESSVRVNVGVRDIRAEGKALSMNGHPLALRGVSIVWNRFCRDSEGRTLAFDRAWMTTALLDRMEAMGANYLRVHLGPPPEWVLDELDRRGLCMQLEWIFFHGMDAEEDSLVEQWRELFALAARHPCVCIAHLWNETDERDLPNAYRAIERLRREMPTPLLAYIDTIHIHKYWWSLFENLSLSYDGPEDFPLPAIADELGGNYLDGDGNPGLYPEVAPAFTRFLGRDHTREERLELQALSNARVAEYWRTIGITGYTIFCALSSPEDGNHHFLGPLRENRPKPVWQASSAALAPKAACAQIWDRALLRGQRVCFPLWFFRDANGEEALDARVEVVDEEGRVTFSAPYSARPEPYGRACVEARVELADHGERCTIRSVFANAVSAWPVRLYSKPDAPSLAGRRVFLIDEDEELRAFAGEFGMRLTELGEACDLVLGAAAAAQRLERDAALRAHVEAAVRDGAGMLLLELGPRALGEGYLEDKYSVCTDGRTRFSVREWTQALPFDLMLRFHALPEPESCCHRAPGSEPFWEGLQRQALQISNGYRGGLNAPAAAMTVEGIGREAYRAQWLARGATPELFDAQDGVAYEICGYYAFSNQPDEAVRERLLQKFKRQLEDAPSLAEQVYPDADVNVEHVSRRYRSLPERSGQLEPVVVCGHALERAVVVSLQLEGVGGRILLSQLLTGGRLHPRFAQPGVYGAHYDPEMARLVLNMMQAGMRP